MCSPQSEKERWYALNSCVWSCVDLLGGLIRNFVWSSLSRATHYIQYTYVYIHLCMYYICTSSRARSRERGNVKWKRVRQNDNDDDDNVCCAQAIARARVLLLYQLYSCSRDLSVPTVDIHCGRMRCLFLLLFISTQ